MLVDERRPTGRRRPPGRRPGLDRLGPQQLRRHQRRVSESERHCRRTAPRLPERSGRQPQLLQHLSAAQPATSPLGGWGHVRPRKPGGAGRRGHAVRQHHGRGAAALAGVVAGAAHGRGLHQPAAGLCAAEQRERQPGPPGALRPERGRAPRAGQQAARRQQLQPRPERLPRVRLHLRPGLHAQYHAFFQGWPHGEVPGGAGRGLPAERRHQVPGVRPRQHSAAKPAAQLRAHRLQNLRAAGRERGLALRRRATGPRLRRRPWFYV